MADEARIERLEDKIGSLEVATAHGFGEMRQDIAHLRELVSQTLGRPQQTPVWVLLLASGTFLLGLGSCLLVAAQLLTG